MKDQVGSTEILTIGYEGSNIDDFLLCLRNAEVETLVDVRELPLSRKKGFSKNGLKSAVESIGISYVHLRSLGDPKEGRNAARDGNHSLFVEIFNSHMQTEVAQLGLKELAEIVEVERACLLCFEKHHEGCHRAIVVDQLSSQLNLKIRHLTVE